jgi:hypothetical protein
MRKDFCWVLLNVARSYPYLDLTIYGVQIVRLKEGTDWLGIDFQYAGLEVAEIE